MKRPLLNKMEAVQQNLQRLVTEVEQMKPTLDMLSSINAELVGFNGGFGELMNALAAKRKCTRFGGETAAPQALASLLAPIEKENTVAKDQAQPLPPSAIPQPSAIPAPKPVASAPSADDAAASVAAAPPPQPPAVPAAAAQATASVGDKTAATAPPKSRKPARKSVAASKEQKKRRPHALLLRNGAEEKLPRQWQPATQRDKLEAVLQFLRLYNEGAGAPISDIASHFGMATIKVKPMLSVLTGLGHVKQQAQAQAGRKAGRGTSHKGFLYVYRRR